ncbi:MAG: hypothetical protein R3C05_14525 [Pirellulaceae bacterium]
MLLTTIVEDASARGRRCKKRMSSCGASRSASWGGSYGSVGSCGTPVVTCCPKPCSTTVACGSSFGSTGGSGGSYTSVGSAGGYVIPSNEVIIHERSVESSGPYEVIVPEHSHSNDGGSVLEATPTPTPAASGDHLHSPPADASTQLQHDHSSGHVMARVADSSDLHAFLVLRNVPADAEIYLLGTKMTARGSLRRYRIPVAAAGTAYDYQIQLKQPLTQGLVATSTKVQSGQTTELWISQAGNELVFVDENTESSESVPLALR